MKQVRRVTMTMALLGLCAPVHAEDAVPPSSTSVQRPVQPAPQMDFGLQWRAQDGAAKNDLTTNTANSIRSTQPGAQPPGSGVSAGFQFKW
jgi:hypothetical protein